MAVSSPAICAQGIAARSAKGHHQDLRPQGWIEVGKGLLKLALLGAITFFWGSRGWPG
jgi:hypothetical protein